MIIIIIVNESCATKIQAAWRGYYVRNCSIEIRKKFEILKYKRSLDYLKYLREKCVFFLLLFLYNYII